MKLVLIQGGKSETIAAEGTKAQIIIHENHSSLTEDEVEILFDEIAMIFGKLYHHFLRDTLS